MNDDFLSNPALVDPQQVNGNETNPAQAAEFNNGESAQSKMRKRLLLQTKRKADIIHEIMFNLDILIYAEICVLYYMEYYFTLSYGFLYNDTDSYRCRFFPFFIRVLFQFMFLTP